MATKKKVKKTKKPAKKPVKKPVKKKAVKNKPTVVKTVATVQRTYISFIIDYSYSMDSIRAETIEHVNEQIERIQSESKEMDTKVSLVTFNQNVKCVYFNQPLASLKPLTLRTYAPSGCTAMLDAVGTTVDRMVAELKDLEADENTAALVVIVSDGMENASTNYSREQVAKRIQNLQNTKRWTFTYLGANQDLAQIHNDLNIPLGNISAFVASAQGMQDATAMSIQSTSNYMSARQKGQTQVANFYTKK